MSEVAMTMTRRALGWINHNLSSFSLPDPNEGSLVTMMKPVGELALTSELMMRSQDVVVARGGRLLLEHCWSEFAGGELLRQVLWTRPDLITLAAIYPSFARSGLRLRGFERDLAHLASLDATARLELPAWRELELAVAFNKLDIQCPWNHVTAYQRSWLYGTPEPWFMSSTTAYSLTHTVFYLTDFGAAPNQVGHVLPYLVEWVPVWAVHYLDEDNLDLAGEMIMVLHSLPSREHDRDWVAQLAMRQAEDGHLQGPGPTPLEMDATDTATPEFLRHYHTTLVGLMAALLSKQ